MRRLFLLCFVLYLAPVVADTQQQFPLNAAEKILCNGRIYTANPLQPWAAAVAIRNERIVAVGSLDQVRDSLGPQATLVDLGGRVLLPGFVDSHSHAIDGGVSLLMPNVQEALLSPSALAAYARSILESGNGMYGDVVMIDGINITTWSDIGALQQQFNHGFFAAHPILLGGSDGHTAWANYPMLQRAGITERFVHSLSPEAQRNYGMNADGSLSGFASEEAVTKLMAALPESAVDLRLAADSAMAYCNRYGITALLDPASVRRDQDPEKSSLHAYALLAKDHQMTVHVAAAVVADPNGNPAAQIRKLGLLERRYSGNDLSLIGFKIFGDGVIEYPSQTAALSQPYRNSGKDGQLLFEPKKFAAFVTAADKAGWLVHVHAIGDRAVTATLDGFAVMRKTNGNSGIPHTITHLQIVLPDDFPRFQTLGILASFQLLWAFGDETAIDIVQPYIAPELFRWQYPARSLLQAGATICGASDWPVTGANPFVAMARAETRKGPLGVLDSTQCMPRGAMLQAYTINAARALRMEGQIGSIEPGKLADMVLVDRDVLTVSPESLSQTQVLWTLFRGRIVYRANKDQGLPAAEGLSFR